MKFTIEIGNAEKTRIEFSRSWFTGRMQTLADGQTVAEQSPFSISTHFGLRLKRCYEFDVGKTEPHHVIIEKQRPLLVAGFRPHTYRVLVDGHLVHEQRGY